MTRKLTTESTKSAARTCRAGHPGLRFQRGLGFTPDRPRVVAIRSD
jgi:hypothetical protein